MHIAASLMTVMARPSCTAVRLFGASHCHVLPLRPACTVVVRSPRGGVGDRHFVTVPQGWWGTVFPGVGNDKGGGYINTLQHNPCKEGFGLAIQLALPDMPPLVIFNIHGPFEMTQRHTMDKWRGTFDGVDILMGDFNDKIWGESHNPTRWWHSKLLEDHFKIRPWQPLMTFLPQV